MAKTTKLPRQALLSRQCSRWTKEIHQEQVKEVVNQGNRYHHGNVCRQNLSFQDKNLKEFCLKGRLAGFY